MFQSFIEEVKRCIDEFYEIYNLDVHISKKRFDEYFDKYSDIFSKIDNYTDSFSDDYKKIITISQHGYEMIDIKNKKYIDDHLLIDKEYFDNIFKEVDPSILLDTEQRKAILADEDYSLVIAGAGSGKTTTMAAKVKYLIEKKHVDSNKIILLSFTNKATDELNHILNDKFNLHVEVLTFHKLGMKFIRNMKTGPVKIISDSGIYKILSDYFKEVLFKDKDLLKQYALYFKNQLYLRKCCLDFNNYDEYYNYYMDLRYDECKDNLEEEIKKRIDNRLKFYKTINGEKVKSEGEVNIANLLYKNSICYQYEKPYPQTLTNGRSYLPDFTINDFDIAIYVEYYGLAKMNNIEITSASEEYRNQIYQKRLTHEKYKTDLIELFGRYSDNNNYTKSLLDNLRDRNVFRKLKSDKEIFYRLMETSSDMPYFYLIKTISLFISLYKELGYNETDFDKLIDEAQGEIKQQLTLLKDAYIFYNRRIKENNEIDFQDMINYAYQNMELIKDKNVKYEYIVIDEYQDISIQRYNFTRKISDLFQAKIVAVGDDWQSIYSFSGSDIDLFTKFYDLMGYADIIKITKTYRNSQELIDLASEFITKNANQIVKKLSSDKHLDKPVEIIEYEYNEFYDDLAQTVDELINKIYLENPNHKILLLGRFNSEIDNLLNSKCFYKQGITNDRIYSKKNPNIYMEFLTVHRSKGLGFDQVVLLNAIDDNYGFPSKLKDLPIIKYIKGNNSDDLIEYSEERRLFYVAMTRTKNKLYIMTPKKSEYQSEFIKEICNNASVLMNN